MEFSPSPWDPGHKTSGSGSGSGSSSVRSSIDFNGPLNALSISPNNKLVAVGGRDVLRIMALEATGFSEKRNLRAGKSSLNFSTNDIRWHPRTFTVSLSIDAIVQNSVESNHLLATAATNGVVVIWNLQKDGESAQWPSSGCESDLLAPNGLEFAGQRVSGWNHQALGMPSPERLRLYLTTWGQDKRGKVGNVYQPRSESVRDVRFSHFQPNRFAAAFENGIIQIWDIRKNAHPELKFTAHKGLVLSVDWHPNRSTILASGGRDRYVKIWDLSDMDMKQQQPQQTIQTIASVGRVAWRPNCSDQIATSASLMDNNIHLWDTQRPCIPLASMNGHSDIASGILWLDTPASSDSSQVTEDAGGLHYWQHMLACSKDGTLKLHSLSDSFKPHQSIPTIALSLSSRGHIAYSHAFIDRSCNALRIQAHIHPSSSLFTVTGPVLATSLEQSLTTTKNITQSAKALSYSGSDGFSSTQEDRTSQTIHPSSRHAKYSTPSNRHIGSLNAFATQQTKLNRTTSHTHLSSLSHSRANANSFPLSESRTPTVSFAGTSADTKSTGDLIPDTTLHLIHMENLFSAKELKDILNGNLNLYREKEAFLQRLQPEFNDALHLVDAFGFDEVVFRFFAQHYVLSTDTWTFSQICAHNALVSLVAGNSNLCHMWRLLDLLFNEENVSHSKDSKNCEIFPQTENGARNQKLYDTTLEMVETLDTHHSLPLSASPSMKSVPLQNDILSESKFFLKNETNIKISDLKSSKPSERNFNNCKNVTSSLLEQLDYVNPKAMEGFEPYPFDTLYERNITQKVNCNEDAFQTVSNYKNTSSSLLVHGNVIHGDLRRLRNGILKELLEYYADRGELQTCVCIAIIMRQRYNVEKCMGSAWMQQMLMHYIEMLHQFRMYRVANEIILKCNDSAIRQMNMKSTFVYSNCANCQKPIESAGFTSNSILQPALCPHCNSMPAQCSICQLPVRGLYVWCPVCSHGGHFQHLRDWFLVEDVCPTGCSHQCSFQLDMLQPC
uniref:Uncharacterized protein AlNc14C156G7661 n=1 Tax=Albugo laibachii Nc14 TaxID=890382 RepID=F0WMH1_9STRA|nr:conserved hypothetical protein [Albugo laibachii Nc14]|eukprot:CCA22503.1 conserved hypothetical protein [Albugo laibachii Nc14]